MRQLVRRIAAIRVVEICILSKFIIEFIRFGPSSTPSDFEIANVKEKLCKIIRTLKSPENSIHLNIKKQEKKNWIERHFWNSFLQTEKNKKRSKKNRFRWNDNNENRWKIFICVCFQYVSSIIRNKHIEKFDTNLFIGTIFDRFVTRR